MKKINVLLVLILFTAGLSVVKGQSIVVNEIYNSSSTDEWVEFLVLQDGLDLRNWNIRDFSSGGTAQTPLNFNTNDLWSSVRKGTVIVVARPENTFAEDTDPSDYTLTIKTNNSLYFTGNPFTIAGSS